MIETGVMKEEIASLLELDEQSSALRTLAVIRFELVAAGCVGC